MSGLPTIAVPSAPSSTRPLLRERAACLLVATVASEDCAIVVDRLRAASAPVLIARTPFEAVVKATCHAPAFVLLDPSLGRAASDETRTLLAQCPLTAEIPVDVLPGNRTLPGRLLDAFAG